MPITKKNLYMAATAFIVVMFAMLVQLFPVQAADAAVYYRDGVVMKQTVVKSLDTTDPNDIEDQLPNEVGIVVDGTEQRFDIDSWTGTLKTDTGAVQEITPVISGLPEGAAVQNYKVYLNPFNTVLTNSKFGTLPAATGVSGYSEYNLLSNMSGTATQAQNDSEVGWQTTNSKKVNSETSDSHMLEINKIDMYSDSSSTLATGTLDDKTSKIPGFTADSTLVAEINSTTVSSLYQDLDSSDGGTWNYSMYHGGRTKSVYYTTEEPQYMAVIIGPSSNDSAAYGPTDAYGTNNTDLFHKVYFAGLKSSDFINKLKNSGSEDLKTIAAILEKSDFTIDKYNSKNGITYDQILKVNDYFVQCYQNSPLTVNYGGKDYQVQPDKASSGTWNYFEGTYNVPDTQVKTVIAFVSIPSAQNDQAEDAGNLLYDINFGKQYTVTYLPNASDAKLPDGTTDFAAAGVTGTASVGSSTPTSNLTGSTAFWNGTTETDPTRDQYEFVGWSTDRFAMPGDQGILSSEDVAAVSLTGNTTYYAVWQPKAEYSEIDLTKSVSGDEAKSCADADFSFTAEFSKDGTSYNAEIPYKIVDADGNEISAGTLTATDSKYTVTIKPEQHIVFTIPSGYDYKITETEYQEFSTSSRTDVTTDGAITPGTDTQGQTASGTTAGQSIYEISFTNTLKPASVTVSKTVTGPANGTTDTFSFDLYLYTLDGDEAVPYEGDIAGAEKDPDYAGYYAFTLTGGQQTTFSIPAGLSYAVFENENANYTTSVKCGDDSEDTREFYGGQLDAGDSRTVAFTNAMKTGGFTVSKTVAGDDANQQQYFTFKVRLTGASGTFNVKYYQDGVEITDAATAVQPSTITASSGGQSTLIQLKHGQSFTVEGLPVTAAYSVEEKKVAGYTPTLNKGGVDSADPAVPDTQIVENTTPVYAYTNTHGAAAVTTDTTDADGTTTSQTPTTGLENNTGMMFVILMCISAGIIFSISRLTKAEQ